MNQAKNVRYQVSYLVFGQLGWLGLVSTVRMSGLQGLVIVVVLMLLTAHVLLQQNRKSELVRLLSAALLGWVVECLWVWLGLVVYPFNPGCMAPFWMAVLWLLFAMQTNVLMRGLRSRPYLSSVLGMFGGPLAYRSGQALGAIRVVHQSSWLVLALAWAVIVPLLLGCDALFEEEVSSE